MRRPRRPVAPRQRAGFTLIELIVATAILGGGLLALASFSVRFARANASARVALAANELVSSRLEQVKAGTRYVALDSLFERTEVTLPNYPGYRRITRVTRVGGQAADSVDYQAVTVTVEHAALPQPVKRTVFIAPF